MNLNITAIPEDLLKRVNDEAVKHKRTRASMARILLEEALIARQ